MPKYLRPYIDSIRKIMKKREMNFIVFKRNLIDYKSNFVSFSQLKYIISHKLEEI